MKTRETVLSDKGAFDLIHFYTLTDITKKTAEKNKQKPLKILDLATGPGWENNYHIIRTLRQSGSDYELHLTDISPKWFKIGYEKLSENLTPEEVEKEKVKWLVTKTEGLPIHKF